MSAGPHPTLSQKERAFLLPLPLGEGRGEGAAYIRPGRDDDAAGFIDLIGACWAEYPTPVFDVAADIPEIHALASHVANHGGALWTAEQGGRVVGMISTYPAAESWSLSRVYVDQALRGSGLGQRLLRLAEDHARAAGGTRISLWSDVLFTRAHAFYEKHGYLRRGGLRTMPDQPDIIEIGYAKPLAGLVVEELDIAAAESAEHALSTILRDCVHAGASVSFLPPLAHENARQYWRGVTRAVGAGRVRLFVAWTDGAVAGTVRLNLDMPQNQSHRGDIRKLLVAPDYRRLGIAQALMQAAEAAASAAGCRLLVLDTEAGGDAERLYRRRGWQAAGAIPGYTLDENGAGHDTAFFFKTL